LRSRSISASPVRSLEKVSVFSGSTRVDVSAPALVPARTRMIERRRSAVGGLQNDGVDSHQPAALIPCSRDGNSRPAKTLLRTRSSSRQT
jgi:hypothetical protein